MPDTGSSGMYFKAVTGRGRGKPITITIFKGVSTEIHWNPARAHSIRIGEPKLREYPWSSYPPDGRGTPAAGLVTERVLGSVGLKPAEGRGDEVYLETRLLDQARPVRRAAWKDWRRGWDGGGSGFRQGLLARLKKAGQGARRASPYPAEH